MLSAPGPPCIIPGDCTAENNTVTIAWRSHPASSQDGFVLELDDGNEGDFRVSISVLPSRGKAFVFLKGVKEE